MAQLNRAIFLPGAKSDPDMSFHDPRQRWYIKNGKFNQAKGDAYANAIAAGNAGVDTLNGMIRMKGISTATPPSDTQLEQNRLAGTKSSDSPAVAAQQAPPKVKGPDSTGSTYVAGKSVAKKSAPLEDLIQAGGSKKSAKPAPVSTGYSSYLDQQIAKVAGSIMDPLTTGITKGVDGYTSNVITDTGMNSALKTVAGQAGSTIPGIMQGTLEQVDSSASKVKVGGFWRPMSGGIGASNRPGFQTGN